MGSFFFGRREDLQKRRYNYCTYLDIPIKYPAFSPFPLRHLVTSRDNQWWRHSLAHVVVDGAWYTLRGENFYYRKVWGNAYPPKKEVFVFWRCTKVPFPPSLFWCLCIAKENVGESEPIPFFEEKWKQWCLWETI